MNRTEIILRLVFIDVIQKWFSIFRLIHRRPLGLLHLRSTSVNTEKNLILIIIIIIIYYYKNCF